MRHEPNSLYGLVYGLKDKGLHKEALDILYEMADGDPSIEAGLYGYLIGECYEQIGDQMAARYWYGRAEEENPKITKYAEARRRLESANIDSLVEKYKSM